MCVTNDIPLGRALILPVGTVNCVQTLKAGGWPPWLLGTPLLDRMGGGAAGSQGGGQGRAMRGTRDSRMGGGMHTRSVMLPFALTLTLTLTLRDA